MAFCRIVEADSKRNTARQKRDAFNRQRTARVYDQMNECIRLVVTKAPKAAIEAGLARLAVLSGQPRYQGGKP